MRKWKRKIRLGEFYYLPKKKIKNYKAQFLGIDLDLSVLTSSKGSSAYFFF